MFSTPASMPWQSQRFQGARRQPQGNPETFLPETVQRLLHLSSMTLTCREFIELLGGYREGLLDPEANAGAESHLMACAECAAYLCSYEETIRLVKGTFRSST